MTIIDTHTHLYDLSEPELALAEAFLSGVSDVVALGVDLASNRRHVELAAACGASSKLTRVHLAFGLHPGNISTAEATDECLEYVRAHVHEAVAIGETGLDFWYKTVRRDAFKQQEQKDVFQRHLSIAQESALPVVIHSRGAWRDAFEMTRASGVSRAVFHWYSGPLDVLRDILDNGYLVSVSPALEYSPEARTAASFAPLDRLLVETDTPVAVNGPDGIRIASTPKDVWRTFMALCAVKSLDASPSLSVLNANARMFFNLPSA